MARLWQLAMVAVLGGCGAVSRHDGTSGSAGAAFGGSAGQSSAGSAAIECEPAEPPDVPMRLLNDYELDHELEQFGVPVNGFPAGVRSSLFTENAPQPASLQFVEQALQFSEAVSSKLLGDGALLAELIGCDVAANGEEACREALNQFVMKRLFRGLASPETSAELDQVFELGVEMGGDYASGVRAVLEVALQSPELHYRLEFGRGAVGKPRGWGEVTDLEMASRLSFLFWDRGPDQDLLEAAERGDLRDAAQLESQARRLLSDPRSREPVRRFYRDLMRVSGQYTFQVQSVPDFRDEIGGWVQQEFDSFVDDATFGAQGDFRALLKPKTWLNAPLAEWYGLSGPAGDAFEPVELDGQRYAGLLTLPAFLSLGSSSTSTHPFHRGFALSRGLLCFEVPPEPPDLTGFNVPPPEPPGPLTTRQRFENHRVDPICASCHVPIDPLGFALEHFDGTGRYRETENGLAIDTTGELMFTDAAGPFDGPAQLAARIAESRDARSCFVKNWASFAYGRHEAEANACTVQALSRRFEESGENVVELLVALTQTESFRYLKLPLEAP